MRSVVVLPQPEGPSRVVKLPRGISSETSSTAAAVALVKRLLRWSSRTCDSGIGQLVQSYTAAAGSPQKHQHQDGATDHRDGECGGAAPVEVIDQLEDS